jgi:hypothetical protein
MSTPTNLVDDIIRYESGESTMLEALELHGALIRSGQAWSLQGHYGRTAAALIESGLLDEDGNLTDVALDRLAEVEEVQA